MDWLDLLIKIAAAMAALAGAVVAVLKLLDRRKLAGTKPNRNPEQRASERKSMTAGRDIFNIENSFNQEGRKGDGK